MPLDAPVINTAPRIFPRLVIIVLLFVQIASGDVDRRQLFSADGRTILHQLPYDLAAKCARSAGYTDSCHDCAQVYAWKSTCTKGTSGPLNTISLRSSVRLVPAQPQTGEASDEGCHHWYD